jgi:hypothetical protein
LQVIRQRNGTGISRALQAAGVTLTENEDEFIWTGGDSSGYLTTKNVYTTLFSTLNLQVATGWRKNFWSWNIQLKIKLFIWLAAENKVLTWKILQHKGWQGPGRCHLCNEANEENEHLFIHCDFTKSVWQQIISSKHYNQSWAGSDLENCLNNWYNNKTVPSSLAALTCWFIWLERNASVFKGKVPSVSKVVIRSLDALQIPVEKHVSSTLRLNRLNIPLEYPLASFDGATKSDGTCSGAGGIIRGSTMMVYKWYLNCGIGSNTKAELIGAWATLYIANLISLNNLQILGDSKVIIDWINYKGEL